MAMDKIGSRGPQLVADTRTSELKRPETQAAETASPEPAPVAVAERPTDGATVSEQPATDPRMVESQAEARLQEFESGQGGESTRLVAGVADFLAPQGQTEPDQPPAARVAAAINQGQAPAAPAGQPQGDDDSPDPVELSVKGPGILAQNSDAALELADGRGGSTASRLTELGDGGTGRISSRLGGYGSGAGALAGALSLPGAYAKVFDGQGDLTSDIAQATSSTLSVAKDTVESSQQLLRGSARRAAAEALRQRMPNAPRSVIRAGAREAAEGALPGSARRDARVDVPDQGSRQANRQARRAAVQDMDARRTNNPAGTTRQAATRAATQQARRGGGTLASTMGAPNRAAARTMLREGGERAAQRATQAVARRAIAGTIARAGGRFVPGLNVAIAAADTVAAGRAWADPNASWGRRITSSITALGSIAAATNIPVVSQIGGAVSAVSSFIGSWFQR